jgi:signal peptidase II
MSFFTALRARRGYFLIALVILFFDQLTKILAHAYLSPRGPVAIVDGLFNLDYSRNPGGLFGYFSDLADPWRTGLLTLFPLVAIGLIVAFLVTAAQADRVTMLGLGLILGGAVGNLLDRLFRGEVVDFLDVYVSAPRLADWLVSRFGTAHWPTFNVADSAIVCGAGLLLLDMLRPRARPAAEANAER